jgi:transcriptional regulator with XRE-family HTH domain
VSAFTSLGPFFDAARRFRQLTVPQLSERAGIPYSTLVKYLRGERTVPNRLVMRVFDALEWDKEEAQRIVADLLAGARIEIPLDQNNDGNLYFVIVRSEETEATTRYPVSSFQVESLTKEPAPTGPARLLQNLPYNVRVFLEEFRLRITKAGATEEEVDRAMQLLRSPSLFTWYSVGTPRDLTEDKVLQGMKAVAENVIIPELRTRGRDV